MPTFTKPEDARDGLTRLFLRAVPENEHGNKTLLGLSRIMRVSRWGMRKWIHAQKISPERAMQVVEISKIVGYDDKGKPVMGKPRVSIEEFHPYVYKD